MSVEFRMEMVKSSLMFIHALKKVISKNHHLIKLPAIMRRIMTVFP